MLPSVATIPITPGTPARNISGTIVAITIAPGSVSSMRRIRSVIGTWPIAQKPNTRVNQVASAITRMPAKGPNCISCGIVDEPSDDAARDRADDDEPPARNKLCGEQRHPARNRPADRAARTAAYLHQHRRKEDRQHQVDAEALRIRNERAEQIAGHDRRHPHRPDRESGAEIDRGVALAFGAVAHADDPGRVGG